MKRLILFFSLLPFAGGKIYAQKAYTYVRQNGKKLEQLGTAAFDVGVDSQPRVHFVDGKAVMTIGETRVAALPMENGGELVVSYTTDMAEADLNKVSKKPTEQKPFATIYSPFQLVVPSGSEVYAPIFDPGNKLLHFADDQRVAEGGIVPVETPLVIHGTSPVEFTFSATDPTCGLKSDLSGSSLKIATPTDHLHLRYWQDGSAYGRVWPLPLYGDEPQPGSVLPAGRKRKGAGRQLCRSLL